MDHEGNGSNATRGFASLDQERRREIAGKGGRAAHRQGTAHEFTREEARDAGRKGGQAVSANVEHMAMIGRRGGDASRARLNRAAAREPLGMPQVEATADSAVALDVSAAGT